jgi:hypothetical protein
MIGLGSWSEPGECPNCGAELLLTSEYRVLSDDEIAQARQKADEPASRG